jgi:hypothetical protein
MNDVVLKAAEGSDRNTPELSYGDVVNTYKAICQHQPSMQRSQATVAI